MPKKDVARKSIDSVDGFSMSPTVHSVFNCGKTALLIMLGFFFGRIQMILHAATRGDHQSRYLGGAVRRKA